MTPRTTRLALASCAFTADVGNRVARPNKRLKLTGYDRFKGSGVLCPGGHGLSSTSPCAGERVARSLSAIR